MNNTDTIRPLWIEGIILSQQHLQILDDSLRGRDNLLRRLMCPNSWGIISLSLKTEKLLTGIFAIDELLAILPSGELINITSKHRLSLPLIGSAGENLDIYLSWEGGDFANGASGYPNHKNSKWQVDYKNIPDKFNCELEREVAFLNMNFNLEQNKVGLKSDFKGHKLHLARLTINKLNYSVLKNHIVPSVFLYSSEGIKSLVIYIKSMIWNKIYELKTCLLELKHSIKQITIAINIKNILQFLCVSHGKLNMIWHNNESNPKHLYDILNEILFGLKFHNNKYENEIETYSHKEMHNIFRRLQEKIMQNLNAIKFKPESNLIVKEIDKNKYRADLTDINLETKYLIIGVDVGESTLGLDKIINGCKITAPSLLNKTILSATSGLKMKHIKYFPEGLVPKHNNEYFSLEHNGIHWGKIIQEKAIAIFVAEYLSNINMEIICMEKNSA